MRWPRPQIKQAAEGISHLRHEPDARPLACGDIGLGKKITLWEGSPPRAGTGPENKTNVESERKSMSTGTATAGTAPAAAQRTSAYAWVVLAMLAFIYIFNFLDRQL